MLKDRCKSAELTIVLIACVLSKISQTAPVPEDGLTVQKLQKPPQGGFYTTRYDHIDVENILNQKRLVYYYAECLLDKGPCPPQGLEFKRILPEALRTNCLYCTPKQRYVTYKSIRRLRKEYPDVWAKLAAIWDPTEDYFNQLEQSVINDKSTNIQLKSNSTTTYIQKIPNSTKRSNPIDLVIRTTANPVGTTALSSNNINSINVEGQPSSQDSIILSNRFEIGDELSAKPNYPIASTTTIRSISTPSISTKNSLQTKVASSTMSVFVVDDVPVVITSKPVVSVLPTITTSKRINISIDGRPFSRPPGTISTPINNLILGTNQILGSLTDIASKVIVTGNNLAGMVLNTVQSVFVG